MDAHKERRRELFFTNLLILGFDPVRMEAESKVKFNREMFHVPNKKAFEIVTCFLFSKLDLMKFEEKFKTCWPTFSKKAEQLFKKNTYQWLQQIAQTEPEVPFPYFTLSVLLSPGGEKFYELYFALSSYVVQSVITRSKMKFFHGMPTLKNDAGVKLLHISQHSSLQSFINIQQKALQLHKSWHEYISHLVQKYRSLRKEILGRKKQLMEEKGKLKISCQPQDSMTQASVNMSIEDGLHMHRTQLEEIRLYKSRIENFYSREASYWDVTHNELAYNSLSTKCLDEKNLKLKLMDGIMKKHKNDFVKRKVERTHDNDGKLDLTSLIQILNVSLLEYQNSFSDVIQKNMKKYMFLVNDDYNVHHELLNSFKSLSSKLFDVILPEIRQSISFLKKSIPLSTTPVSLDVQGVTLEALPPSPSISFSPFKASDSSSMINFELTPPSGNTPEVPLKRKNFLHCRSPLLNDPLVSPQLMKMQNMQDESSGQTARHVSPVSIDLEIVGKKQFTKWVRSKVNAFAEEDHVSDNKESFSDKFLKSGNNSVKHDKHKLPSKQLSRSSRIPSGKLKLAYPSPETETIKKNLISEKIPTLSTKDSDLLRNKKTTSGAKLTENTLQSRQGNKQPQCSSNIAAVEDIFVDKVVGDVMGESDSSAEYQLCVVNSPPMSTWDYLGVDAFTSREKLIRTPPDGSENLMSLSEVGDHFPDSCNLKSSDKIPSLDKMCMLLDSVCSSNADSQKKSSTIFTDKGSILSPMKFPEFSELSTRFIPCCESDEDLTCVTLPNIPLVELDGDLQVHSFVSSSLTSLEELTCYPVSSTFLDIETHLLQPEKQTSAQSLLQQTEPVSIIRTLDNEISESLETLKAESLRTATKSECSDALVASFCEKDCVTNQIEEPHTFQTSPKPTEPEVGILIEI